VPEPAAEGDRARRLNEAGAGGAAPAEPTLPELLARGWRRAGLAGRIAGAVLALLLLALALWLLFGRGGGSFSYDGPEAPPFSLSWTELERVDPAEGELLRLESESGEELAVEPLEFEVAGPDAEPLPTLALEAGRAASEIERGFPGARIVLEGRTELAVDQGPEAYQLAFTAPVGEDEIVIGKRFFVPDPNRPGEGVQITIGERTDDPRVIEKVEEAPAGFFLNWPIQLLLEDAASVRTEEGLEEPLRSFEFG
jgi:hypothetical protein